MEYNKFLEYNKRSMELNGTDGCVFIKEMRYLSSGDNEGRYAMAVLADDAVGEDELPDEAYCFEVERMGFSGGWTSSMLLGSIISNTVAGNIWVANPQRLAEDDIILTAEVLPSFVPIKTIYVEEEKVLRVFVDDILVAVCCLPELFGISAVHDVYRKAVGNLRKFGFITKNIEGRLLSKINKALAKELPIYTNGIEIGVLKEGE